MPRPTRSGNAAEALFAQKVSVAAPGLEGSGKVPAAVQCICLFGYILPRFEEFSRVAITEDGNRFQNFYRAANLQTRERCHSVARYISLFILTGILALERH
ncbi:hypothetical protein NDU88_006718 [Pleurodeles waltl]|uniref:Uncharacterized protein n=1 Tax=Pleurodeles waltl TaxID=8319 RepID=A0AAV7TZB4_PLEWA|nr:hypothetical protein NDU88_006718 [Pleurodeles waltl]